MSMPENSMTAKKPTQLPSQSTSLPENNSPSIKGTTTTVPTPETTHKPDSHVAWKEAVIHYDSLEEYKNTLLTFKNSDAIYKALLTDSDYSPSAAFAQSFEMLLVDRYFLLPLVPSTGSLSQASFFGYGASEFSITLSNGESIFFVCRHDKEAPGEIKDATRTIITNSRGVSIAHDHVYSSIINAHCGFYTWQEGEYYCRMAYEGNNIALYEAFVKELSFEKISINA